MIRTLSTHFLALVIAACAFGANAAIEVNKASQADLETVKGIGPKMSDKILAERQKGAFKDWSDMISRVGGIGAGSAGKLSQAGLTVGGSAYGNLAATTGAATAKPAKAEKTAPAAKVAPAAKADAADKPARAAAPK